MKSCIKCGTDKPFAEFYLHEGMTDGHEGACKECRRIYSRKNRQVSEYYKTYKKNRKVPRLEIEGIIRNTKLRRKEIKGYRYAHKIIRLRIKAGKLQRQPCEMCGSTIRIHAHHDDYSKPLDVMWLCGVHHQARHAFLRYINASPT